MASADEQQAAVAAAIASVQALRAAALATLPERSRGRRRIVEACDAALASAQTAVRGMSIGDEPNVLQRAWRASVDAARRAYESAQRTVQEVANATEERLAQLWRTTRETARAVKEAVASTLAAAAEKARAAVDYAYRYLAEQVGTNIGAAVLLIGLAALWLFKPSKN
jgi:hypothetical protein